MTYEEAEKLALAAIHDTDGRGMVGRGRNHLHQRVARAILHASPPPPSAPVEPVGWKLVPVEPTDAMCDAAFEFVEKPRGAWGWDKQVKSPGDLWTCMLAASPPPPSPSPEPSP